jgi:hypothetical protein
MEDFMKSMAKWMLGAAVAAAGLGMAATPAKAAEWGVYIGGPTNYVPPCPGPGYSWVAGYYSGGYWVPGRWSFVGYGDRAYYRDGWRDHERREWREHEWREHEWREHHGRDWDRDRDHDRWRR